MTDSKRTRRQDAPQKTAKSARGGMLLGLFLGLVIGVLIAFGVVLYLNKSPLPFMNKYEGAPRDPAKPAQAAVPGGAVVPPGQPLPLPGKPGDKAGEKPRFEFHDILVGKQPAVPGAAPAPAQPPAAPAAPATPAARDIFYLQAGAFQKAADADNLKAKLALLGVEASVQEADVADKGRMHRVRVGPIAGTEEMNRIRNQLAQGGVQATVVKHREPKPE